MTDEDERAVAQLRAVFGDRIPKPAEPRGGPHAEVGVDDKTREIDAEFARRLLEPSERKWQRREDRRNMSSRVQEGTR